MVGLSPAAVGTPGSAAETANQTPVRVPLITGDVVILSGGGRSPAVMIDPADRAGGRAVRFDTERNDDGLYVIPSDARPRLATGLVDRELFNVRRLARQGVTGGAALPVIVTYRDGGRRTAAAGTLPAATGVRPLPVVDGAAVRVRAREARRFWSALGRARDVRAVHPGRGDEGDHG